MREKILSADYIRQITEQRLPDGNQKPFSIRARSTKGHDLSGENVICMAAYPRAGQRLLQYPSGDRRRVYDCLIFKLNDYKIVMT
ncbi:MAG: hypothetical protein RR346_03880 [Bacteroidales bacterium]